MANTETTTDEELLKTQAHVWNQIFNYINSASLKCAVQLGIPEIIHSHNKPISLSNLIASLHINTSKTPFVYRLMRILVHSKFFIQQNNDQLEPEYSLTLASRLLLKDEPFNARSLLLFQLDPILTKPLDFMSQWFQNDNPTAFDTAYGMSFWDYGTKEPMLGEFFNEAMARDSELVRKVLIGEGRGVFEGLKSVVDVGGGSGLVARAIAGAFPDMKCKVLDLPHVVAGLEGTENLEFIGGNMFKEVPSANAVLLKWILHDWSDEEGVKILKKCKAAIPRDGKVIIIDIVMESQKQDHESVETQLFFDLLMMVMVTGKERNEKEWEKLFLGAGFRSYKIIPMLGLRSIIEVYP